MLCCIFLSPKSIYKLMVLFAIYGALEQHLMLLNLKSPLNQKITVLYNFF